MKTSTKVIWIVVVIIYALINLALVLYLAYKLYKMKYNNQNDKLVMAQCLFGLCFIIAGTAGVINFILDETFRNTTSCVIWNILFIFLLSNIIYILVSISFVRYTAMYFPSRLGHFKHKTLYLVLSIFIFSVIISIPYGFVYEVPSNTQNSTFKKCLPVRYSPKVNIFVTLFTYLVVFIIPLVIMSTVYPLIIYKIYIITKERIHLVQELEAGAKANSDDIHNKNEVTIDFNQINNTHSKLRNQNPIEKKSHIFTWIKLIIEKRLTKIAIINAILYIFLLLPKVSCDIVFALRLRYDETYCHFTLVLQLLYPFLKALLYIITNVAIYKDFKALILFWKRN